MPSWSEFNATYWGARTLLVLAWLWIARQAWIHSTTEPSVGQPPVPIRQWQWVGVLAAWLAVLRATRLDWRLFYLLHDHAPHLHDSAERIVLSLIGFSTVCLVLWFGIASFSKTGIGAPFAVLICSAMVLFTIWETFSVEELLPLAVRQQPGRYVVEYTLVALAALTVWGSRTAPLDATEKAAAPHAAQ